MVRRWWLVSENTPAAEPPHPLHRAEPDSKGLLVPHCVFCASM